MHTKQFMFMGFHLSWRHFSSLTEIDLGCLHNEYICLIAMYFCEHPVSEGATIFFHTWYHLGIKFYTQIYILAKNEVSQNLFFIIS